MNDFEILAKIEESKDLGDELHALLVAISRRGAEISDTVGSITVAEAVCRESIPGWNEAVALAKYLIG